MSQTPAAAGATREEGPSGSEVGTAERAFSGAGVLASLGHASFAVLVGLDVLNLGLDLALAGAGLLTGGAAFRRASGRRLVVLVAVLSLQSLRLAWWLAGTASSQAPRLVVVAAVLLHVTWFLALTVRTVFRLDLGRALLLSTSLCASLFAAETLVPAPKVAGPEWRGRYDAHPQLGHIPPAGSVLITNYPDDPRGYLQGGRPSWGRFLIDAHDESRFRVERLEDRLRVVVDSVDHPEPWRIQAFDPGYSVRRGRHYRLTFRARSDQPRPISFAVSQNRPPWQPVGPYLTSRVGPEWRSLSLDLAATRSDDDARLLFDLGGYASVVELSDAELRDLSTGAAVVSTLDAAPGVSYRFDSRRIRGPERALPPPGALRVLALGDSFTLGVGVHEEDTFASRLERILSASISGRAVRVFNAGVSGYGTHQERLAFNLMWRSLEPRIVLLGMVWNDDPAFAQEQKASQASGGVRDLRLFGALSRAGRPSATSDFHAVIEEVKLLDRDCRDAGAVLVPFLFCHELPHERWRALGDALRTGLGPEIPWLDLGPALRAGHRQEELFVHPTVDMHPNEIAHRIAAEELARYLKERRLLDP